MSKIKFAALGVAALGVAALPVAASYAEDVTSRDATYTVTVEASTNLNYTAGTNTATIANGEFNTNVTGGTLNARTNNKTGYNITVKSKEGTADMTSSTTSKTIAAGTTLDGSVSNWALKAAGTDSVAAAQTWFAVPAASESGLKVAESSTSTTTAGVDTTITFGAGVASDLDAATYSDTVTYTIAPNAAA